MAGLLERQKGLDNLKLALDLSPILSISGLLSDAGWFASFKNMKVEEIDSASSNSRNRGGLWLVQLKKLFWARVRNNKFAQSF